MPVDIINAITEVTGMAYSIAGVADFMIGKYPSLLLETIVLMHRSPALLKNFNVFSAKVSTAIPLKIDLQW